MIVFLFVIAPVVLVGFWAFTKLLPAPTCFDNRKNQRELDVDCGGPCAPCELRNPKPVTVFWARAVPVRKDTFDAVALIQNPNEVLSSQELAYEFTLFDQLGVIARRSGRTFIFPQERMYAIEINLKTTRQPERVDFRIVDTKWQLKQGERHNFAVERRDYRIVEENGRKQSEVEASIMNRSSFGFKEVVISFVLFDQTGNVVGVNKTAVDNFLSGSRRIVKSIWPEEIKESVATIEIESRVNIFDQNAILKPQ